MAAALLAGGGLLLFGHHTPKKVAHLQQTVGDHTISLNQANAPDNSGGLSVSSAGADLGQLNNSKGQSGGSSSGSGSGSSSGGIDPSTFKQYDKYKDSTSGLFADVQKGTGTELTDSKKAAVVYEGWLTDGTLFDESKTGSDGKLQPFVFTLGAHQVITGWEQAITGMKVGGTRLMIIPPSVGYGAQGQGPVPGNAVLVFLVQLADVQ